MRHIDYIIVGALIAADIVINIFGRLMDPSWTNTVLIFVQIVFIVCAALLLPRALWRISEIWDQRKDWGSSTLLRIAIRCVGALTLWACFAAASFTFGMGGVDKFFIEVTKKDQAKVDTKRTATANAQQAAQTQETLSKLADKVKGKKAVSNFTTALINLNEEANKNRKAERTQGRRKPAMRWPQVGRISIMRSP